MFHIGVHCWPKFETTSSGLTALIYIFCVIFLDSWEFSSPAVETARFIQMEGEIKGRASLGHCAG